MPENTNAVLLLIFCPILSDRIPVVRHEKRTKTNAGKCAFGRWGKFMAFYGFLSLEPLAKRIVLEGLFTKIGKMKGVGDHCWHDVVSKLISQRPPYPTPPDHAMRNAIQYELISKLGEEVGGLTPKLKQVIDRRGSKRSIFG